MAYTFKKGKHPPFSITISNRDVKKAITPEALLLRKLRKFLDANEPALVYILMNLWRNEQKAVTYKELREAILAGYISEELLAEWRQDYSKFVVKHLQPAWEKAIAEAIKEYERRYPEWKFDPMADGIRRWTEQRSAEFVTDVTVTQMQAIRSVVEKAAVMNELSVDELARAIRAMVGLYPEQANANLRYYNKLIEKGVKAERALDLSVRYGARQHRYRAMMIARQELAMAYNTGAHEAVKQAQAKGYMGDVVKVACCADDERVCKICGALDGAVVGVDEDFKVSRRGTYKFTRKYPPFHIKCRCTVMYKEISPPNKQRG